MKILITGVADLLVQIYGIFFEMNIKLLDLIILLRGNLQI